MSVVPRRWPLPAPQVAEAVAAIYCGKRERPLPVLVRDELGEWLADEQFAGAYGVRGKAGLASAELLVSSLANFGIALVTPMLADTSPQARAGAGFDRTAFSIDFNAQRATCPQGHPSSSWNPVTQRGTDTIVITFAKRACGPCPVRAQCTTSASGRRQLTVHLRNVYQAQLAARATQATKGFKARYALRAGVEGTIRQGVAVTGMRHARYRGLARTRLEHASAAVAVNLIRLHAWWNGHPLDRTRTSHLEPALAS
jgi:Transposase DDE domain